MRTAIALILLSISLSSVHAEEPAAIVVAKETTFITEPLGEDGLPDYRRAILNRLREGVDPANNGAVLFWEAVGRRDMEKTEAALVFAELGVTAPEPDRALVFVLDEPVVTRVAQWLRKERGEQAPGETWEAFRSANPEAVGRLEKDAKRLIHLSFSQPWRAEEIPPLAEWVSENTAALDLLVAAAEKPQWYDPSPSLLAPKKTPLISTLLYGAQFSRNAQRSLLARCMFRTNAGDVDGAIRDLSAARRLAPHVTKGLTLVEQIVAIALAENAQVSACNFAFAERATAGDVRLLLTAYMENPLELRIADAIDIGERLMVLDSTKDSVEENLKNNWQYRLVRFLVPDRMPTVDFNVVFRIANRWFDKGVLIARLPAGVERREAAQSLDDELDEWANRPQPHPSTVRTSAVLSEELARIHVTLLYPAHVAALKIGERALCQQQLTAIALAAELYRRDKGAWPQELSELDAYLDNELLTDPLHQQPFKFVSTDDDVLVYSIGPDGVDDGGSCEDRNVVKGFEIDEVTENWRAISERLGLESIGGVEPLEGLIPEGSDDIALRFPPLQQSISRIVYEKEK